MIFSIRLTPQQKIRLQSLIDNIDKSNDPFLTDHLSLTKTVVLRRAISLGLNQLETSSAANNRRS